MGIGVVALGTSLSYMGLFAIGLAVEGNPFLSPWSAARRDIMGVLWVVSAVTTPAFLAAMWWAWRPERAPRDFVVSRDAGRRRVVR